MKYTSRSCYQQTAGFTLIELMIAVVIIAIISAVALPSYRSYILKSHRSEAYQALTQYQTILERCYAQNLVYNGACYTALTFPVNSTKGYYSIAASNMTATTYTLTATAQNAQASDTACATLAIDQANTRTATPGNNPVCWTP